MWFDEAESYVTMITIALLVCCLVWHLNVQRRDGMARDRLTSLKMAYGDHPVEPRLLDAPADRRHNIYIVIRTVALVVIAFSMGMCVGIEKTATGSFKLPLGVMQKQLHEVWGVPLRNLQRPKDR